MFHYSIFLVQPLEQMLGKGKELSQIPMLRTTSPIGVTTSKLNQSLTWSGLCGVTRARRRWSPRTDGVRWLGRRRRAGGLGEAEPVGTAPVMHGACEWQAEEATKLTGQRGNGEAHMRWHSVTVGGAPVDEEQRALPLELGLTEENLQRLRAGSESTGGRCCTTLQHRGRRVGCANEGADGVAHGLCGGGLVACGWH
jgi:hypothetical protein